MQACSVLCRAPWLAGPGLQHDVEGGEAQKARTSSVLYCSIFPPSPGASSIYAMPSAFPMPPPRPATSLLIGVVDPEEREGRMIPFSRRACPTF